MENIIDYKYFIGSKSIPQISADYVRENLDLDIKECQENLLKGIFVDEGYSLELMMKSRPAVIMMSLDAYQHSELANYYIENRNSVWGKFGINIFSLENPYYLATRSFLQSELSAEVSLNNFLHNSFISCDNNKKTALQVVLSKDGVEVSYLTKYFRGDNIIIASNPQEFGFQTNDINQAVFELTVDLNLYKIEEVRLIVDAYSECKVTGFNIGNYKFFLGYKSKEADRVIELIKDALANLVYCFVLYNSQMKLTQSGAAKSKSENSKHVSPISKHVAKWNENVRLLRFDLHPLIKGMFKYRYSNKGNFEDYEHGFFDNCACCEAKKNPLYSYKNSLGL